MSVVENASDNTNCSFLQYNQSPQSSLIIGSPTYITIDQVRVNEGIVQVIQSIARQSSTRGDFAVIRTNLKFGNRAFSVAGPTAFLFQFAKAHLLPNLSQN